MSRDDLAVGAESQRAALPKSWTVFQQLASCLCRLEWLWLVTLANAALLSPYVWLQSCTLAVSKRLGLFRYASTACAMWKRGKQEHPVNLSTQQLSAQPSWDRLWCLCERRKVSVQACTTAARYGKKGPEILKCGRQTDPRSPHIDRRWTTAILRQQNQAWKEDEGGTRGQVWEERGDEANGEKSGQCWLKWPTLSLNFTYCCRIKH